VREYLTPDRIANSIRMVRTNPQFQTCSFLVVEGVTDEKVYGRYVDRDKCQVVVAQSKDNAIQALTILEKANFQGILAIVDADFDVLEGKLPATQNLLFTDTHDLETMMLQSPALEKVLSEHASEKKIAAFDVRTVLIECGKPIGYLRWLALREGLSMKFEGLTYEKFVDKERLKIDALRLIRLVQSRSYDARLDKSQGQHLTDNDIHDKIRQLMKDSHDPWHICCGHDLVCILSCGLRKAIGTKSLEPDDLEKDLRLAFELSHFCATRLYASIRAWEKINEPFVILSVK
jgi:hypothetical protein